MPDERDIAIDRTTAQATGARFYRGVSCKRGHDGLRYTSKNKCYACCMAASANRAPPDDAERARKRAWKRANPEAVKASHKRRLPKRLAADRANRARRRELTAPRKEMVSALSSIRDVFEVLERSAANMERRVSQATRRLHALRLGKSTARISLERRKAERPDEYRAYARAKRRLRQLRERDNGGRATLAEKAAILHAQGYACAYCPETEQLELDHKYPVKLGGTNWPHNLQYLCRDCNNRKRDVPDIDYRRIAGLPEPDIEL